MKAYSIPALIIASICLTIALSDTLAWVRRDRKRSDLAFILICLSGAAFCFFCAGEYNVDTPAQSVFWLKGEVISSTMAGFAMLWFVAEVTGLIKRRYVFACLAWTILAILSQILNLGELTWVTSSPFVLRVELPFGLDFVYKEVRRGIVLVAIASIGFLVHIYLLFIVLQFRRSGHHRESSVLLQALGFIVFALILDFAIGIGILRFVFMLEYAWLATILVVGLNRSNDFIETAVARKALKETGEELKDSQTTLSTIIDSTADMIWSVDIESYRLLAFNRSFQDYLSRYRGVSLVAVGMNANELRFTENENLMWARIYQRGIREGAYSQEIAMSESSKVFRLSVNPLGRDGRIFGLSLFAEDITERKKAEEEIARSLSEKEVLLREVYHRTKNNMNVIVAILKLQANEMDDERLRQAYAASINRILAMSSVHDKLYMTDNLSRIDLKEYIRDLANRLIAGYSMPDNRPSLVMEMDSVRVTLDTAINCGLIINKLISNALKYAFPNGRKGEIRILLARDEAGRICLTVSDNGVGTAPSFDTVRNGHLGLRIINSLAQGKLRAQIDYGTARGFSCALVFAEEDSRLGENEGTEGDA